MFTLVLKLGKSIEVTYHSVVASSLHYFLVVKLWKNLGISRNMRLTKGPSYSMHGILSLYFKLWQTHVRFGMVRTFAKTMQSYIQVEFGEKKTKKEED